MTKETCVCHFRISWDSWDNEETLCGIQLGFYDETGCSTWMDLQEYALRLGRVSRAYRNLLDKDEPEKFEYVPCQDCLKHPDYSFHLLNRIQL